MSIVLRPVLCPRAITTPCITSRRQVRVEGHTSTPSSFRSKSQVRLSTGGLGFRPSLHSQKRSFNVATFISASGVAAPPPTPRDGSSPRPPALSRVSSHLSKRPPVPRLPSSVFKAAIVNRETPATPSPVRFNFSSSLTETTAGLDSRCPSVDNGIPMIRTTTAEMHLLSVRLPEGFESDMITVSVKKGDILAVVADKWTAEKNSHHEWRVKFEPTDVNMSLIRAKFDLEHSILTIVVGRHCSSNMHMTKRAESCH